MKVLVINAGSSSLKYQFIDMQGENIIAKGLVERIGTDSGRIVYNGNGKFEEVSPIMDHVAAFEKVLSALTNESYGVIRSLDEIGAVGHRVLHTGEDFKGSIIIDQEKLNICKKNAVLGPLHMPANIACIEAAQKVLPTTPMVAVFDTAFHSTMPDYAYMYAIPYKYYETYKVRKYGFHGTSHKYVTGEAIKYLGGIEKASRIITCHLGNGSSIAAVKDGKVIDTSMGLTPLEGLIMGTRSGDVDPAVVEFLAEQLNMSAKQIVNILNKESGFIGIAGSSDFRDLTAKYESGDEKAILAVKMFQYRVKKYIAQYYVALGGCDAIIMTGGIGENAWFGREVILENLECIGIELDKEKNKNAERGAVVEIQKDTSKTKIIILPTNEELVIARESKQLVENK